MTPEHRKRESWPTHPFLLDGGDALLISCGTTTSGLLRLQQGMVYPGFPAPSPQGVKLELQPIGAGQLKDAEAESDHGGRRWLADQIRAEQGLPPCTEPPSAAHVLELVLELHQRTSEQFNTLLASHEPLNQQSEEHLFRAMELDEEPAAGEQQPSSDDPLLRGLLWLFPGSPLPPPAPGAQRPEPRQRLLDLLERSDLFGREVLINDKRARLQQGAGQAKTKLAELTKELEKRIAKRNAGFGLQAIGGNLGNDYIYDTAYVTDGKPHYTVSATDGKEWSFFTDGKPAKSLGSKSGTNNGKWYGDLPKPDYISLGDYTEGKGEPRGAGHKGAFAEILIYGHSLSGEQLTALDRYVKAKYHGEGQSPEPPVDGLRFWLDAKDIDANAETPNPAVGARVAAWVDKVTGTALGQGDPNRQPKMSRLGQAPALYFDKSFLRGSLARGGLAKFLDDQSGTLVVVFSADHTGEGYGFEVGGGGAMLATFINPAAESGSKLRDQIYDYSNDLFTKNERDLFYSLENRDRFVKQHLKRLSPEAMSLRHSFGPPYEPGVPVTTVKLRGEYDNHGKVVKAGFPSIVTGHTKPAAIRLDPFKRWPTRSRRMALVKWIASKDNPLTARVMMNRLWYRHFGRGIVKTPSDFGKLSGGASHPELLDWLAGQFVDHRWSLKAMHRLIVTSSTYKQSSFVENEAAEEADPLNDLWWKYEQRRLDAEAIRDSVLAASGRLNSELYGLPIFPPLPGDIAETVKYSQNKWDTQIGHEGRKRSIYIYQQRTLNMPFMQAFDSTVCDESRPRRRTSVTPLQALSLFNGDFVNEEANALAKRVQLEAAGSVPEQVRLAYRYVLSRPPSAEEAKRFGEFLAQSDDSAAALNGFCRVLLNTNEFVYVD